MEHWLLADLQVKECLNGAWMGHDRDERAPSIMECIMRFNELTAWLTTEILLKDTAKERAQMIGRIIHIGELLLDLQNFSGVMSVCAALQGASVYRLKKSWALVKKKHMAAFERLMTVIKRDGNSKAYRSLLHSCNPPCVPYLGIYLTDLTFISDGNPERLPENEELTNWTRLSGIAAVVMEIKSFAASPYCLVPIPMCQDWFTSLPGLDDDELHALSLAHEPRAPRRSS